MTTMADSKDIKMQAQSPEAVLATIDAAVKTATESHQAVISQTVNSGVEAAWKAVHAKFIMQMQEALGYGKNLFPTADEATIQAARAKYLFCEGWVDGEYPCLEIYIDARHNLDTNHPRNGHDQKEFNAVAHGFTNFGRRCRMDAPCRLNSTHASHYKTEMKAMPNGPLFPLTTAMMAALSKTGLGQSGFVNTAHGQMPVTSGLDVMEHNLQVIRALHAPKSDLYLLQQQKKELESFAEKKEALQKEREALSLEQKTSQDRFTRFMKLENSQKQELISAAAKLREVAEMLGDANDLATESSATIAAIISNAKATIDTIK